MYKLVLLLGKWFGGKIDSGCADDKGARTGISVVTIPRLSHCIRPVLSLHSVTVPFLDRIRFLLDRSG